MIEKTLMRHLHMGCGEPLKTELVNRRVEKNDMPKSLKKQDTNKNRKAYPA